MGEDKNIRLYTFEGTTTLPTYLYEALRKWGVPTDEIWRSRRVTIEVDKETGHGSVYLVLGEQWR